MIKTHEIFKHVRKIQLRTHKYVQDVLAGAYHSAFKGRGMEFEDVREYFPGDEVRNIDWNVTARMQYPYVKNFKEERELTVILLVDVSASTHFGSTGKRKEELFAELAALLSFSAIKNNDQVGLILFSDHVEKYFPPQKGLRHILKIMQALLVFKPRRVQTNISAALTFLGKIQKRKGIVFLISDFLSASFEKEIIFAGKKHDVIGINVRDPREMTFPKMGLIQLKDLETNKVWLLDTNQKKVRDKLLERNLQEIEALQRQFERHAGGFIHICSNQPYIESIKRFFDKRRGF